MTSTETKLISINAALAERAERLRKEEAWILGTPVTDFAAISIGDHTRRALKAQIRDLEIEKHALLQELPLRSGRACGYSAWPVYIGRHCWSLHAGATTARCTL